MFWLKPIIELIYFNLQINLEGIQKRNSKEAPQSIGMGFNPFHKRAKNQTALAE
jgi:hypothetical protein